MTWRGEHYESDSNKTSHMPFIKAFEKFMAEALAALGRRKERDFRAEPAVAGFLAASDPAVGAKMRMSVEEGGPYLYLNVKEHKQLKDDTKMRIGAPPRRPLPKILLPAKA